MRPSLTVAQAISLRGMGSGALVTHLPGLAALRAGLSVTCCVALSGGIPTLPGCFRLSYMPP